ncbi:MAG: carboxypeptidase-like regulatory domain-containing protein [Phycisphaerales bacterium]
MRGSGRRFWLGGVALAIAGACLGVPMGGSASAGVPGDSPIPMVQAGIGGVVVSAQTGQPVGGRLVTLSSGRMIVRTQRTDPDGFFLFDGLFPGSYVVQGEGGEAVGVNIGSFHAFVTVGVP